MHKPTELGLYYRPYGGVGLVVERLKPEGSAEPSSLWRFFKRLAMLLA